MNLASTVPTDQSSEPNEFCEPDESSETDKRAFIAIILGEEKRGTEGSRWGNSSNNSHSSNISNSSNL